MQSNSNFGTDKTQVFHDQIEVKQKELQPWTAKINTKRAEIDVASSEREALVKRAEALKAASEEAQETLEGLQSDQAVKVRGVACFFCSSILYINRSKNMISSRRKRLLCSGI